MQNKTHIDLTGNKYFIIESNKIETINENNPKEESLKEENCWTMQDINSKINTALTEGKLTVQGEKKGEYNEEYVKAESKDIEFLGNIAKIMNALQEGKKVNFNEGLKLAGDIIVTRFNPNLNLGVKLNKEETNNKNKQTTTELSLQKLQQKVQQLQLLLEKQQDNHLLLQKHHQLQQQKLEKQQDSHLQLQKHHKEQQQVLQENQQQLKLHQQQLEQLEQLQQLEKQRPKKEYLNSKTRLSSKYDLVSIGEPTKEKILLASHYKGKDFGTDSREVIIKAKGTKVKYVYLNSKLKEWEKLSEEKSLTFSDKTKYNVLTFAEAKEIILQAQRDELIPVDTDTFKLAAGLKKVELKKVENAKQMINAATAILQNKPENLKIGSLEFKLKNKLTKDYLKSNGKYKIVEVFNNPDEEYQEGKEGEKGKRAVTKQDIRNLLIELKKLGIVKVGATKPIEEFLTDDNLKEIVNSINILTKESKEKTINPITLTKGESDKLTLIFKPFNDKARDAIDGLIRRRGKKSAHFEMTENKLSNDVVSNRGWLLALLAAQIGASRMGYGYGSLLTPYLVDVPFTSVVIPASASVVTSNIAVAAITFVAVKAVVNTLYNMYNEPGKLTDEEREKAGLSIAKIGMALTANAALSTALYFGCSYFGVSMKFTIAAVAITAFALDNMAQLHGKDRAEYLKTSDKDKKNIKPRNYLYTGSSGWVFEHFLTSASQAVSELAEQAGDIVYQTVKAPFKGGSVSKIIFSGDNNVSTSFVESKARCLNDNSNMLG